MTPKIDLNMMATDKEIKEEYRKDMETKIKDIFYLSLRRRSSNRNDENDEKQRPEQHEDQPAILTIPPPLYT